MDQKELTHLRLKLISKWKEEHSKRVESRVHNSVYSSEISNDEEDSDDVENLSAKTDDDCSDDWLPSSRKRKDTVEEKPSTSGAKMNGHEADSSESCSSSSCDINSNGIGFPGVKVIACPTGSAVHELEESSDNEPAITVGHDEYLLYSTGDLVWAYVSGYPLWPSLISFAPGEHLFTKLTTVGKLSKRMYHVQYFGEKVSHCWVLESQIFPFKKGGVEELMKEQSFQKHISSKSKIFTSLQLAIKNKRKNWIAALGQAERSLEKIKEEELQNVQLNKDGELKENEKVRGINKPKTDSSSDDEMKDKKKLKYSLG